MILLWKEQDYKEINEIMALWHTESLALANMTTTKWENRADHLCINSSPNRTTHKLHRDLSNETMALKWKRQITINTTELTNSIVEHQLWLLEIQIPITQISKAWWVQGTKVLKPSPLALTFPRQISLPPADIQQGTIGKPIFVTEMAPPPKDQQETDNIWSRKKSAKPRAFLVMLKNQCTSVYIPHTSNNST